MEEPQERKQDTNTAADSGTAPEMSRTDREADQGRTMAGLSYLIFFLPLMACPQNEFARFHANQSLILLITCIAGNLILGIIPVIGWILLPIYGIAMFVLCVMGMMNGFAGKEKRLPLIGGFDLIKQ
jgi:uncharacterized membrane protein